MCDPKAVMDDEGNVDVTCQISGKPITESNEYGMFCEDMCELEACKHANNMLERLIRAFCPEDQDGRP